MINTSYSASFSALTAKTGSSGAEARISNAEIGVGNTNRSSQNYSVSDLFRTHDKIVEARWKDAMRQSSNVLTGREQNGKVSEATLTRIKKRMIDMSKALEALTGSQHFQGKDAGSIIMRLVTGDGNDAVSLQTRGLVREVHTNGGDDAVSLKAAHVQGVYTGDGADAVVIEADRVEGVATDLGYQKLPNGDYYIKQFANNDALTIAAKSVSAVGTGAGSDAIAIEAGLASWIHAGDGNDSMVINAGMVGWVNGGRGNDTITVNATIGDGTRHAVPWTPSGGTPGAAYERPTTIEGRMQQAARSYADVKGEFGDDTITVSVEEMMAVSGDDGNDRINIEKGTVALLIAENAGDDVVRVAKGGELVIKFDNMSTRYSLEVTETDMIIRHGAGTITIENYKDGDAIGIDRGYRVEIGDELPPDVPPAKRLSLETLVLNEISEENAQRLLRPGLEMLHIRAGLGVDKSV